MKVLYLVPQPKRPDRIGAYSFLDEEIQALAAAGIEAYVLSRKAPADTTIGSVRVKAALLGSVSELDWAAFLARHAKLVPLHYLTEPGLLRHAARLELRASAIVKEERIDLIHSHFAWPEGFGGMLASAVTGVPLVASLRGTDILLDPGIEYGRRASSAYDRTVRRLLAEADRTVYFSAYMRNEAVSLGARPEACRVIRKGVDLTHFTPATDRVGLRHELGLGSRPLVLTVAGLIQRKGVHHILQALVHLREALDFTFVVCGDGPERESLEALASDLGMADRVVFKGRVDRTTIPKYFAACDVFVLGSIVEAAGNVLFEAMSCGRPVVCTDSGGPPEYVRDGEAGFVVPVGDREAMAERIRQLLTDPLLQDRLGREARRRTAGEFDFDRMVSELIAVYAETLRAPAGMEEGYPLRRSASGGWGNAR